MTLDDRTADELVGAMAALAEGETLRAAVNRAYEDAILQAGRTVTRRRPIAALSPAQIERLSCFFDAADMLIGWCCIAAGARVKFAGRKTVS